MKTIILTIISLIIYEIGKKIFQVFMIKRNKQKLNMIINNMTKNMDMKNAIDDYWDEDIDEKDFENKRSTKWI